MNRFAWLVVVASAASGSACVMPGPYYYGAMALPAEDVLPRCSEDHPSGCVFEPDREPEDTSRVIVVEQAPARDPKLEVVAFGSADRLPTTARFDPVAAHAKLEAVDLSNCRAHALARGYLHARVAFEPSGRIGRIFVDEAPGHPGDLPDDARACIRAHLAPVAVPAFGGSPVTIGASWFVP